MKISVKKITFLLIMLLVSVSANAQTYNQKGKTITEPTSSRMIFDPKENGWAQIRAMNAVPVQNVYNGENVKTYDGAKNAWENINVKNPGLNSTKCVKKDNKFVCN